MKSIQKFTLNTDEAVQTLSLKQGHNVVRIEYLVTEKAICLWVEAPLRADIPDVQKNYVVRKTHQPVPDDYAYVHTAIDLLKPQAFHLFEVVNEASEPDFKHPDQGMNMPLYDSSTWAA